jgi:hypothetical protein
VTGLLLTLVIIFAIACLVVREQTEFRLSKMRADLLGLRTEEKRMEDTRTEVEQMVRWFGETLNRATSRQRTAEQYCRDLEEMLAETGIEVPTTARESVGKES